MSSLLFNLWTFVTSVNLTDCMFIKVIQCTVFVLQNYTYLAGSLENITSSQQHQHQQSSSSSSATSSVVLTRKPQTSTNIPDYAPPSVQHGSYTQELLKQSQNTKYLLSQGNESSRKEGVNSANSSSVNLSDTSFSSGGSGQAGTLGATMPQPGSQGDLNPYHRDHRTRG